MTGPMDCAFESELLVAMLESRWPTGVDDSLRGHVSTCAVCSTVAVVAGAIHREQAEQPLYVPDSGRVWWRAQVRARREDAETALRPILVVQLIAFACAIGLLGACFGASSTWFQYMLRTIRVQVAAFDIPSLLANHAAFTIGLASLLLAVPAAVYFAIRRE